MFKNLTNKKIAWYIFYTYPRAEKIACDLLRALGYEVFLPLKKRLSVWKNRQCKIIEEPLFPSYVFIKTQLCELDKITKLPKICYCLSVDNRPSVLPDDDIDTMRKLLASTKEINVDTSFEVGETVMIVEGELSGCKGVLLTHNGKDVFGIKLVGTHYTAFINIGQNKIVKI